MSRRAAPATRRSTQVPQSRAENVWNQMTEPVHDESDRWNVLEEHLIRAQEHDPKEWKYFAK